MAKQATDSDGKSKTASAMDAEHYPEHHKVGRMDASTEASDMELSDYDWIARRAYELWKARGCPAGSPEQDWFDAQDELRAKVNSENVRNRAATSGSVQR